MTAIPSYLFVSSPLASGPLSRAVLLMLSSVSGSVWRRGLVSDPGMAGPATQPSGTSWASEETVGWPAAAGKGGGSGGGGGAAVGGGGTMSLLVWSASSISETTMEGCSGSGFSAFASNLLAVAPEGEEAAPSGAVRGADCFPGFFLPLVVPDVPDLLEVSLEALGWDDVDEGDGDEEDLETGGFFAWEELAKIRKDKAFYNLATIWFLHRSFCMDWRALIFKKFKNYTWYFYNPLSICLRWVNLRCSSNFTFEVGKTETVNTCPRIVEGINLTNGWEFDSSILHWPITTCLDVI